MATRTSRSDLPIRIAALDRVLDEFRTGSVSAAMETLCHSLREVRLASTDAEWTEFVSEHCLKHPLRRLLHQDPLTWRSFHKPRGYAGDAAMLDYIYSG